MAAEFDIISALEHPESVDLEQLRRAFILIAASGVLESFVKQEAVRLAMGSIGLDDESLAQHIQRFRAETQGMLLIHSYGLSLAQEDEEI